MSNIEFRVNGKLCKVGSFIPRYMSLNAYLRYVCCLPGTKAMCREGGCGACIVTVRSKRFPSGKIETYSVNSCLVLVFSCHGWEITTIEGIGNRLDGYSDIQKHLTVFNGSQCGFCSPGFVMHMNSLKDKNLTMAELERSFGSNTCRCTGFRSIMDAMKSLAIDASPELCQKVTDIEDVVNICSKSCHRKCSNTSDGSDWCVIDDTNSLKTANIIALDFGKHKFFKVYEQSDIFDIFKKHGVDSYMLVDGNTGKGIVETFEYPRVLIDISDVQSLKQYKLDQNLILGANVALEDCKTIFTEIANANSDFTYLKEFVKHFELIAHIPVRKIGSLAGNLTYKHRYPNYPSDVFLLLESVGATVTIRKWNDEKKTMTVQKFLEYNMQGCLLECIELPPLSKESHVFRSYKIMPRNQNALAIVNAAFLIKHDTTNKVEDASIVYGNIDPHFVHATITESYLKERHLFDNETLQGAIKVLNNELKPIDNPPEQSPSCRKKLALGLFYKFLLSICPSSNCNAAYRSGGELLTRPLSQGIQEYQTDPSLYPINQPVNKLEATIQCSGEARYTNDLPAQPGQVFAAFVLSTIHGGKVDKIYKEEILKIEGVIAIYTAGDVPGVNSFILPGMQLLTVEEEIFATDIKFYGQPIAMVVADDEELAAAVAKKVRVTYKNVNSNPPVLTIAEAKQDSSRCVNGDGSIEPKGRGNKVTKVIKGVYEIEGQYHYYMEPLTTVVVPVDNGYEVYDSTQWMELTQTAVARCLNITESKVLVKVSRVGGGFGGKISRNGQVAAACALAAYRLNRPCRFILPIQTNLVIAGKRLPTQCTYEVGTDDDGIIQYLDATLLQDEGCSLNDNVTAYTASSFPNCYDSSNFSVKTTVVLTDTASNTFARAPGTCEAIATVEHIMNHIAFTVQKDPLTVRLANLKSSASDLKEMIDTLKNKVNYDKRVDEIKQFNASNRWMKRAININVMDFPVIYYGNFTVLISVYRGDGTVTITTGGIEMGQGANTKVAQVCARELGIPLSYVHVISHFSFVAANNCFSGSSITTESICYAAIKACATINNKVHPVRARLGDTATWEELVKTAGAEEIELSASYMMNEKEEDLSGYSAYAVSIIELQLCVLTGRFQLLRVDILEDVGVSINPALDVGQVEGAFMQGVGYFTCEKLVYDKTTGKLLTNRSLNYHVPLAQDIPISYNIHFRFNSKNTKGVLGAKTCGEMGICTAHGVTLALRDCIMASRKDSGYNSEWLNIAVPYETEVILGALDVKLAEFILS